MTPISGLYPVRQTTLSIWFTVILVGFTAAQLIPSGDDIDLQALLKIARQEAARSPHQPATGHGELLTLQEQKANGITTLEGDMDISLATGGAVPSGYRNPNQPYGLAADVVANKKLRWPNNRVPYLIDERFSPTQKKIVEHAMKAFHKVTCVRFVPKTSSDANYLYMRHVTVGCYAPVGYQARPRQWVSLADTCFDKFGSIIHELMHAIGFFHTQSRTDRDNYITINWDELLPSMLTNFEKLTEAEIDDQGQPYDFGSLMHYPKDAFAKQKNQIIISPKRSLPPGVVLGQRIKFSKLDIKKINILYQCRDANVCNNNEVQCGGGWNSLAKCGRKCDGVAQCSDGRDERGCSKPSCPSGDMWQCNTVKCIPTAWLCDGTRDCPNGEDEKSANCNRRKCARTDFDCGKCVPAYHVCDGMRDCPNWEDEEASMCNKRQQQSRFSQNWPSQPQQSNRNSFFPSNQPNYYSRPPQQNYFPYFSQGFGSFLKPFSNFLGFDAVQAVERHCFFDVNALHQQPAIRLKLENVKHIVFDGESRYCNIVSLGYAQIDPDSLKVSFGPNAKEENEVFRQFSKAKADGQISGIVIVTGSGDDSNNNSPAIETLRTIGSDVAKSNKFAAQLVTTLRTWNATGLSFQWLKLQLEDRAAFTGLIRALAQAFQYDPFLHEKPQQSTGKHVSEEITKSRLLLSLNVVPEIQPGHDKNFIWSNVDYINVVPDREATRKSKTTTYTNELLTSLASSKSLTKSWLVEDESQNKSASKTLFLKRINIGVEFAPISWTLNSSAVERQKQQYVAGQRVRSLGLPGPLSGTIGKMNVGEICLLNSTSGKGNAWQLAVDSSKSGGGAPYAYHPARAQWVVYETPTSLRSKLKAAKLLRFNGVYVVDVQNDDIRGLCGKQQVPYQLLSALAKTTDDLAVT